MTICLCLCRMTQSQLKPICETLTLERSGSKEMVVARILEFLMKPADTGKSVPQKRKRELIFFLNSRSPIFCYV